MTKEEILSLSETDIRNYFINPALEQKGWMKKENTRSEYHFTDGRIFVTSNNMHIKKESKYADYYLFDTTPQQPITIVEAKKAKKDLTTGIQQAIEYGKMLDLAIVYASNGLAFREFDLLTGQERDFAMDAFPTQAELTERILKERNVSEAERRIMSEPYYFDQHSHEPRYYQRIAINRTVEAIARGQNRILLVMATGTGKTFTAFQIVWRLHHSGMKKRILYLADRNILIDQTMKQDFKPFQKIMTKVQDKTMDSSYEIHMALYQQLVGTEKNPENAYEQFAPNFFDLVIVDECHRGSVKESSAWKAVLKYFSSATHIGLTATPKDADGASNIDYFGEPVYTYSLRQGIEDGFLAPYKVTKSLINVDLQGYEPTASDLVATGTKDIKDWYNRKAFGREIVIEMRQKVVAKRITEKLREIGRMKKTIVFCTDVDEAGRMRDYLVEFNQDMMKKDSRYIMRITGEDYQEKKQLDNFIDPYSPYPTIVTTSELLSTGVDCKTCALIVIDKEIESMTQFKQIIGRGTRIYEFDEMETSKNKYFFDILDFRGVTDLFHQPEFDGDPLPNDPVDGEGGNDPVPYGGKQPPENPSVASEKHVFRGRNIRIQTELVSILGPDGRTLETTNLFDFTKKNILQKYATLDAFLHSWSEADRKEAIIKELQEYDVIIDAIKVQQPELWGSDVFDVICYVAFGQKPLTRKERANNVRKRNVFAKYGEPCQKVLEALLDKYSDQGILNLEDENMLKLSPFKEIGNKVKIYKLFGGKDKYKEAIKEFEYELYNIAQ
jgi:type I restriction enzyme R subunit